MTEDSKVGLRDLLLARARDSIEVAHRWVSSSSLRDLLSLAGRLVDPSFGPQLPPVQDTYISERVGSIYRHSAAELSPVLGKQRKILDFVLNIEKEAAKKLGFRGGKERFLAEQVLFEPETSAEIRRLCSKLGLITPNFPPRLRYAKTIILGAAYRTPLLRAQYAAHLARNGIKLGDLYFLGSPRPLVTDKAKPERPLTESYAFGAVDEFDLMAAAAESAMSVMAQEVKFLCGCTSDTRLCPAWQYRDQDGSVSVVPPAFTHDRVRTLLAIGSTNPISCGAVLSASTSRPPARANTADTFELLARSADFQLGERVLVVTTQIFVPFQGFDAQRCLGLVTGAEVDTVGFGEDWYGQLWTTQQLLQETFSAIRSARRLIEAANEILINRR